MHACTLMNPSVPPSFLTSFPSPTNLPAALRRLSAYTLMRDFRFVDITRRRLLYRIYTVHALILPGSTSLRSAGVAKREGTQSSSSSGSGERRGGNQTKRPSVAGGKEIGGGAVVYWAEGGGGQQRRRRRQLSPRRVGRNCSRKWA